MPLQGLQPVLPKESPSTQPLAFYVDVSGNLYVSLNGAAPVLLIPAGSFVNPMTAIGDLIVGGVAGIPTRFPIGTTGQVPTVQSNGTLAYATPSSGGTSQTVAQLKASTTIGPSTNVETSIFGGGVAGSLTLSAGLLNALGKTLRLKAWGVMTTKGNPAGNITLKLKLGGTTIFSQAFNQSGNATNIGFVIELTGTVQTIGATGALIVGGIMLAQNGTSNAVQQLTETATTGTPDLTSALAVDLTQQYATSDLSNTMTFQGCTVEVLG